MGAAPTEKRERGGGAVPGKRGSQMKRSAVPRPDAGLGGTGITVYVPAAPAWLPLQAVTDTKRENTENWKELGNDLVPSNINYLE